MSRAARWAAAWMAWCTLAACGSVTPWDGTAGMEGRWTGVLRITRVNGNTSEGLSTLEIKPSPNGRAVLIGVVATSFCAVPMERDGEDLSQADDVTCEISETERPSGGGDATVNDTRYEMEDFEATRRSDSVRVTGRFTVHDRTQVGSQAATEDTNEYTVDFEGEYAGD